MRDREHFWVTHAAMAIWADAVCPWVGICPHWPVGSALKMHHMEAAGAAAKHEILYGRMTSIPSICFVFVTAESLPKEAHSFKKVPMLESSSLSFRFSSSHALGQRIKTQFPVKLVIGC